MYEFCFAAGFQDGTWIEIVSLPVRHLCWDETWIISVRIRKEHVSLPVWHLCWGGTRINMYEFCYIAGLSFFVGMKQE